MPRTVVRGRRPTRSRSRSVVARPPRTYAVFSATVTNAGTVAAGPSVDVAGPTAAGWILRNATTGQTLHVNYAVPSGRTLTVDLKARTLTLDGGSVVTGAVDLVNSTWWTLAPGANTVQASVAAIVRHRDAWR